MPDNRFSKQELAALWQTAADLRRDAQAIIERAHRLREQSRELHQQAPKLRSPKPNQHKVQEIEAGRKNLAGGRAITVTGRISANEIGSCTIMLPTAADLQRLRDAIDSA
jgi:hypothetical protein